MPDATSGDLIDVSVRLDEEDLLGLHALAAIEGIAVEESAAFSDMTRYTLRRGVIDRLESAGLPTPPSAATLEAARRMAPPAPADAGTGGGGLGAARSDHARRHPAPRGPGGRDRALQPTRADQPGRRVLSSTITTVVLAGLAVVAAVVVVGGYAGQWAWTGFPRNGQVWDWMNLLLFPTAVTLLPAWVRFSEHVPAERRRMLGSAVVVFIAFVAAGYVVPLGWTGFRGQTLWNWLTLILLPAAVTTRQAWRSSRRPARRVRVVALTTVVVAWAATLVGGYGAGWRWTGYPGNTMWDWLQLLLAPIAINTVLVPALVDVFSGHAAQRAAEAAERRARAEARRRVMKPQPDGPSRGAPADDQPAPST